MVSEEDGRHWEEVQKDNEGRLTITWYHKKQKTLVIQGINGELLKEKLCKFQSNSPQTTNSSPNENNDTSVLLDTNTSPQPQISTVR